jgi:hypothetical protein
LGISNLFNNHTNKTKIVLFSFSLVIISPFFLGVQINAIRQGFSFLWLLLAFSYYLNRKKTESLFLFMLAISFHYSAVMYITFFLINKFSIVKNYSLMILLSVLYFLGLTKGFVEFISHILNLPIYDYVSTYDSFASYRSGIRVDFLIFSLLPYFLYPFVIDKDKYSVDFLNIYLCLIIPFLLFGWANYSNRYAMNAWLFMPLIFVHMLKVNRFNYNIFLFLACCFLSSYLLLFYNGIFK